MLEPISPASPASPAPPAPPARQHDVLMALTVARSGCNGCVDAMVIWMQWLGACNAPLRLFWPGKPKSRTDSYLRGDRNFAVMSFDNFFDNG